MVPSDQLGDFGLLKEYSKSSESYNHLILNVWCSEI
jgi:hypothetical protein